MAVLLSTLPLRYHTKFQVFDMYSQWPLYNFLEYFGSGSMKFVNELRAYWADLAG